MCYSRCPSGLTQDGVILQDQFDNTVVIDGKRFARSGAEVADVGMETFPPNRDGVIAVWREKMPELRNLRDNELVAYVKARALGSIRCLREKKGK